MLAPKKYDVFILAKDINPIITRGMTGVILEVWAENIYEAEFVKEDGSNYGFDGSYTFSIDETHIAALVNV